MQQAVGGDCSCPNAKREFEHRNTELFQGFAERKKKALNQYYVALCIQFNSSMAKALVD